MFKRGVSAKDLRPFSVADPLGQKRDASPDPPDPLARYHTRRSEKTPAAPDAVGPAMAAKIARLGCLAMVVVWAMGLVGSASAWLPELLDEVRPIIEELLAKWEKAQGTSRSGGADGAPTDAASSDAEPNGPDASPDPALSEPPATDPLLDKAAGPDAPTPGAGQTELQRTCERTVQCCLIVQGERARSICENFRRMPVAEPCLQAYEAFAQVGSQLGRRCQE